MWSGGERAFWGGSKAEQRVFAIMYTSIKNNIAHLYEKKLKKEANTGNQYTCKPLFFMQKLNINFAHKKSKEKTINNAEKKLKPEASHT